MNDLGVFLLGFTFPRLLLCLFLGFVGLIGLFSWDADHYRIPSAADNVKAAPHVPPHTRRARPLKGTWRQA